MAEEKFTLIDRIEEVLIAIMLSMATLLVFSQVVARYVFNSGISWATEMVEHLFLWIVMIGASYGFKHGVHLGVDLLMKKLPPAGRKAMSLVAVGISLVFTVGMLYLSVFYVLGSYKMELITVDLEIPQWIPHLALPFGFGLISIRLAQVGWLVWQDRMVNLSQGGEPAAEHIEEIID
jgi:C4-dicarboxylate transporter DctQ subunit